MKQFTSKDGGSYRHALAFRLYLYLVHYKSGRLKWNERKLLVQTFNSSHTAVKNALLYLESNRYINIKKGWIEANGIQKLNQTILKNEPINVKFEFNLEIILDRKKFSNHLFLCCFQAIAMIKGRKIKKQYSSFDMSTETPQLKTTTKIAFIQRQSYSYQAKMMDRHEQTMVKRNKLINAENHYLLNPNPKRLRNSSPERTALTKDGFNTKEFSLIIGFQTKEATETHLGELKVNNPTEFENCYVGEANHGGYVIIKHLPLRYEFMVNYKKVNPKLNFQFN